MRIVFFVGAAVLAAGCSAPPAEPDALTPHQVTGRVLYDGQPAAGVVVTLFPMDAPVVPQIPSNPRAVTGPDGAFTISTFGEGDGAPAGGYRILLFWPGERNEKSERGTEGEADRLLGWYDVTHSKFDVRVKPGANAVPVLKLVKHTQSPAASKGIPGQN